MSDKLTASQIQFLSNELRQVHRRLGDIEKERMSLLHKKDNIYQQACDAGCDNDGNVHRSNCSIYKLKD